MKINLKARLHNKAFVVTMAALIIAFVYQVLGLCGVVPSISEDAVKEICALFVNLLGMLGILVDPTTTGINDSERAQTYYTEDDVRQEEDAHE